MSTNASAIFGAELRGYSSTLGFCIGRSPKRFLHIKRCLENLSSGEKRAASGTERVGETAERAHGHTEQGASHCLLCALSAVVLPERVGLFGGGRQASPTRRGVPEGRRVIARTWVRGLSWLPLWCLLLRSAGSNAVSVGPSANASHSCLAVGCGHRSAP